MTTKTDNAKRPASLSNYSFKERLTIRIAEWSFYLLILIIGRTIRYEVEGWDNFEAIGDAGRIPIYSFWHDRIFASTYFFRDRGIAVITSQSKDGEYIARFIQRLGYSAVRGSSTRGGVRALIEMIRMMRSGIPMGFTLDGPKGPPHVAKSGAVLLAKKTGNPVMPFVTECLSFWRVNSWDRLQIPKPFTRAKLMIGPPIYVDPNGGEKEIEAATQELQLSLDSLVQSGREWSASR